jgi:heterotetrameric sarcosine oxidase gamma subunit
VSDPVAMRLAPARSGRAGGPPGLVVREIAGLRTASVIARRGAASGLSEAALAAFGVALPTTPRAVEGRGATFIWTGPAQWLVEAAAGDADIEVQLTAAFGGLASVCEQSDSRVVLELSGPRVREVLAKGVPIDLHPERFRSGDVALTVAAHVGVQLRQVSEAPAYRLAVVRSYFGGFWHWLAASAAEYGCEVAAPGRGAGGPAAG